MKKLIFAMVIFLLSTSVFGQTDLAEVEFTVIRLDYQSFSLEHMYYFTQPIDMATLENNVTHYHGLDVEIIPAGDFGSTTISSVLTGQVVYYATTVWDGMGEHRFPTEEFKIRPGDSPIFSGEPIFYDLETYFFGMNDYEQAEIAWKKIREIKFPPIFKHDTDFGVLCYLHYFSVGMSDPRTAEWIFIIYSLPPNVSPYFRYHWVCINNNLPNTYINSIAPHSFFGDSVWIGTNGGAFFSANDHWELVKFAENPNVKVTTMTTIPNPFVNCLCSVVGLGTEEPASNSMESGGSVFRSMLDGRDWEFTNSPDLAVTALAFNRWIPLTMYAGLYHQNPNIGGLYRLKNNTEWEKIEYLAPTVSYSSRINCITIDDLDTNKIYIGTNRGLYYTDDNTQTWYHHLENFNVVSIVISHDGDQHLIYAATNGISRSDGIYLSMDYGKNWEVIHWHTNIISLVQTRNNLSFAIIDRWQYYMAVSGEGVFESMYGCRQWRDITANLTEKRITCLAVIPNQYRQLYLGTQKGIYKYVPYQPKIDLAISDEDLAYWPPHPKDGELVELYATVHNNSPYPIFNVQVSFVDNADGLLTVIVPIDTLLIPCILPYSEYTLRAEWYPEGQQGDNIIIVNLDPQNKIHETFEDNNLAAIQVFLESPPYQRQWVNISYDLPNTWINDIAGHPFIRGHVYAATNAGAFNTTLNDKHWYQLKFDEDNTVKITQIIAEMHPYLDCTVPVLWLGSEEYSDIPEDRLGRVFMSEDGGEQWVNTKFPNIAVSAINVPQSHSLTAHAAAYNPFYYKDDYYIFKNNTWIDFDLTPGDSIVNRINCFTFDWHEESIIYVGSQNGLYIVNNYNATWRRTLDNLNVVSIIVPQGYRYKMIYAATRGESYCDGIYKSNDDGNTWEKIADFKNIVSLVGAPDHISATTAAPHFYLTIYGKGIFESRNGGYSWIDITQNLIDKKFTCLAVDRLDPEIAYLGTEHDIYYFDDPATNLEIGETIAENPNTFQLYQNYPNPFNNSTMIAYYIPDNLALTSTKIKIYNALGQEVKAFNYRNQSTGIHKIAWDGTDNQGNVVNSGIYICQISNGRLEDTIKIVLLK